MTNRPNVLLIHSDQHRYDCIAANDMRRDIQTPNLDALAAAGTRFSHAFSTCPICTPARASLLTGAWPTTHGCFCIPTAEIDRAARPELPVLTNLLTAGGYRIAWTGKYHNELEGRPDQTYGIEEYANTWLYGRQREQRGIPKLNKTHGPFGDVDHTCPPDKSSLAWQADQVIRQIEERRDGPFFVRWDPPQPHLACNPTTPFAELYADMPIEPWQSFPDTLEGKPAAQRRQQDIWGVAGWPWDNWRHTVRLYYSVVSEMDHHIGRVLDHLEDQGLANNTLVIYSTDHGDFCGGHSMIDKHFNMYDDVLRVPLIVRWPSRVPAGRNCDAFASGAIDIARTILSAAGIDAPDSFVGEDLLQLAADPDYRPRSYAYSQYFGTESGAYSCRMLRDHRYKFVYHPVGDCNEFYDLQEDPGELHNRINDPAAADIITRLKSDLWDLMADVGDPLAGKWSKVELKGVPPIAARNHMPAT